MSSNSIAGFILAGGASRRMGTDKARLMLDGLTLIETIAAKLAPITNSITVIGQDALDLGLTSTPDVYEKWGALGGLHAALSSCRVEWALISACDQPLVSTELFQRMLTMRIGFEAVAPIQEDNYPQPLCALYRVEPCLKWADELIRNGERRPIKLLEMVNTRWLQFSELSDLNGASSFFVNINTPEDYTRVSSERRGQAKG